MLLKAIFDHLKGHPAEYLLLLVIVFGVGWQASALADFWVEARIIKVVETETRPLKVQVTSVQADIGRIQEGLNDLLARSLKRELIEIRTLLCYTPGDRRLLQNYEDTQERYQDLTGGHRYEPPPCDVLKRVN